MKTLADEPKIIAMAHGLGIHDGDRVEAIKQFCRQRIKHLISDAGTITTIAQIERIVCERLHLTIFEIRDDAELGALIEKFARREKEPAFAALWKDLDAETFATLIQLRQKPGQIERHYVAVIDCRGEKAARRFFTRWHEIAHVLTTFEQMQFPFHRSTVRKDAVEQMMDIIAGDVGFFEPLFAPLLNAAVVQGRLTFASVDSIRKAYSAEASLEATLNASAARLNSPVVLLQAAMGLKRDEERALNSNQYELIPMEKPTPRLRVASAIPNTAARSIKLMIPRQMRVPAKSVITESFTTGDDFQSVADYENLDWWSTSDGSTLRQLPIHVEAMKVCNRVWAIMTPALAHQSIVNTSAMNPRCYDVS